MELLRGSQETWLKFIWENIKNLRCSHLFVTHMQACGEKKTLPPSVFTPLAEFVLWNKESK